MFRQPIRVINNFVFQMILGNAIPSFGICIYSTTYHYIYVYEYIYICVCVYV